VALVSGWLGLDAESTKASLPLGLGALGVVFGDIGTSPLYALRSVLHEAGPTDRSDLFGVTSLVVWALVTIVGVLHVVVLLTADNEGEGGIMALASLVRRQARNHRVRTAVTVAAMIGAALFLGDSILTPAISVLAASEGLKVASPSLGHLVVPLAIVILLGVFLLQRVGSGRIGVVYGPVMLTWFLVLGVGGAASLAQDPQVLEALSPQWGVQFLWSHPLTGFLTLGAVVLVVTGAEALYTDLGHFGRPAISAAWWCIVFPSLLLAYLGETAAVLRDPTSAGDPFYAVVPSWATVPVLVLGTCATVIASEAVIAGAFTVLHQAAGLSLFPDLRTLHTSGRHPGQIYQPASNWALAIAVLLVVVGFRSSQRLASAYGVTVSATVVVTVIVYLVWAVRGRPRPTARLALGAVTGLIAVVLFAATLPKLASGGWVPCVIAAAIFLLMHTWWTGQNRVAAQLRTEELKAEQLGRTVAREGSKLHRVPGQAVFLTHDSTVVPVALRVAVETTHLVPDRPILLSWDVDDTPTASAHQTSVSVQVFRECDWEAVGVSVVLGYRERLDAERILRRAADQEPELLRDVDPGSALFVISEPIVRTSGHSSMARWRRQLFVALDRLAPDRIDQLALPRDRTLVIGRELDL
jgi:KUP system potassium uptake protein